MSNIDKHAQYESKFSRLWERYDEASHGNAEQMRDILEVTLDAIESAERQILRLEKLAEAESVGADKAATSGVEWMKRYHAAEKRIAELEAPAPELKMAHLINKFYERYPLAEFKSDTERSAALGYFMAGAELQCFGEFINYAELMGDE